MRLITYARQSGQRIGAWINHDRQIVDLREAAQRLKVGSQETFLNMESFIAAGEKTWDRSRSIVLDPPEEAVIDTKDVTVLAPLPVPPQIRDFLAFEQHLLNGFAASKKIRASLADDPEAELKRVERDGAFAIPAVWYKKPLYYITNRFSVVGPDFDIQWPAYSKIMDYELELAAIIGRPGADIPRSSAGEHIFGFTIFNDFSARDEQMIVMEGKLGPGKGKEFDGGNALGPCIVTLDEVGDYNNLKMQARINGDTWSRGSSADMHYKFDDMIWYLSQSQVLHPGEVFCSGTVGTGCGAEQMKFLKSGDIVELDIERIGILRNRVILHESQATAGRT
jgi:2-keto-4-pentenoate hydratase/2-oxohepta-3-ene-1,7-dioic acid hydratase in catechol pathway